MITHTKQEILDLLKKHPYLVSFLQKEKLFFKFIRYSMNPKWDDDIDYINANYGPRSIIMYSFHFTKTKEGHVFWCRVDSKFNVYYKKYEEI